MNKPNKESNLPLCKCGCGERVTKPENKYIWGHHRRKKHLSKTIRYKISKTRTNMENDLLRDILKLRDKYLNN